MPSSNIFQSKMSVLFIEFPDVIVYINNILLFTKGTFDFHLERLELVLGVLRHANLHVHVEETFLAADRVDYLGYTITTKGVMPQNKKITALLSFAKPTTPKQLRSFIGFVNFYKKLIPHRSHDMEPLTRVSNAKRKLMWGDKQRSAFTKIRNSLARSVLLSYPDFSKPFDVTTDASDFQSLGL